MAACLHLCRQALEIDENNQAADAALGQDNKGESVLTASTGSEADCWREDAASAVEKAFRIATATRPPDNGNSACT